MKYLLFAILGAASAASFAQPAKPVVIAHRGASGYLPEHTLEAKVLAHAMGADFLEQDIVLTKDDVPVVMHDIQLETTSDVAVVFPGRARDDGHYYALDFTFAEIKRLRAHERINSKTGKAFYPARFPLGRSAFQIPSFEEELELIEGLNKTTGRVAGVYPEIKQPGWHRKQGHDISRIVLPILRRYGYAKKTDPCWLQCFEFDEVQRLRAELGWEGKLVLLLGAKPEVPLTPAGLGEIAKFADGIGPTLGAIVAGQSRTDRRVTGLVKDAHAARLVVHPYTHRPDDLPKFAETSDEVLDLLFNGTGVDGLFTDFPDVAARWLAAQGKR